MNDPAKPASVRNEVWSGHPSQLLNLKHYAFAVIVVAAVGVAWFQRETLGAALARIQLEAATPYLQWLLLGIVVIVLLNLVVRYVTVRSLTYRIINGVLQIESGILSRRTEMIELFRVRDIVEERPFLMRLAGLGNIAIVSSDATSPTLQMRAIGNTGELVHVLRDEVNASRQRNRVMGMEVQEGGAH